MSRSPDGPGDQSATFALTPCVPRRRGPDPDPFPTRAEALAWVAAGVYAAPPGMRFEPEAWTPIETTEAP